MIPACAASLLSWQQLELLVLFIIFANFSEWTFSILFAICLELYLTQVCGNPLIDIEVLKRVL